MATQEKPSDPRPDVVQEAEARIAAVEQVIADCEYTDYHGYGCLRDMEPLTEPCDVCGAPDACKHCLERMEEVRIIRDLLTRLREVEQQRDQEHAAFRRVSACWDRTLEEKDRLSAENGGLRTQNADLRQRAEQAEQRGHPGGPILMTDELCGKCGGNGVVKIPGGISMCDRCDGRCYEPTTAKPTEGERAMATRLRELAASLRRTYGPTNGYIGAAADLIGSAADMLEEPR